MVAQGVISKVERPTDWCSGLVVVPKSNKTDVRLCVDLTQLSKAIKRDAVVILLLIILCMLTILSYLLHQQRDCKRLSMYVMHMVVIMILYLIAQNHKYVFDTMKYGHMKNIMLGQKTLNVTKSYTYLGHNNNR